jgi:hypothetical protein
MLFSYRYFFRNSDTTSFWFVLSISHTKPNHNKLFVKQSNAMEPLLPLLHYYDILEE